MVEFREIDELYLFEFLRNLSMSIVGIFIPIYIVSEGLSLYHAGLFIATSGLVGVLFSYPVSRFISKRGFKHGLASSYFLILPGLLAIRFLDLSISLILVSGVLYNTGRIMHNICLNSEFAVDSSGEKRGKDSGRMLSLPNIAEVAAPFLGGVIFVSLGFNTLLAISIALMALSVIPLLMTGDHRDPLEYDFREIVTDKFRHMIPVFISRGVDAVASVSIFALFIYFFIGGATEIGGARSLDSLGFVLTGLITGAIVQRYGTRKPLIVGAAGNLIVNLFRGFVSTPLQAFSISFLGGIMFQIYHVPLYSWFAELAEDSDVLEFYTMRKIFVSLGNILVISVLFLFYHLFGLEAGFRAVFVLASLAMLVIGVRSGSEV